MLKITLAVPRKHKTSPSHNFRMGLVPFRLLPFCYLIPLGAISPTRAKCDQNNVKQFKQAVQVYKVKGIIQKKRSKGKFKTIWVSFPDEQPQDQQLPRGMEQQVEAIARKAHPNVFELVEIFKQD